MGNEKNAAEFVKEIADMNLDFPQWYTDIVLKTQLCDYGPVKGTMVIRPYGYAIWENIVDALDKRIKDTGHKNAYFPLFIPESFLKREAEHVEGFAPEVALVTHVGLEKLAEPLVVRPTSETVICEMYAKWVNSWRDLPLLINQWANIVRMEKTTRPFLRTSEFLWQEGHTLHSTSGEAEAHTIKMLNEYIAFCRDTLAIPLIAGRKSEKEKFAGAVATYAIEAMMQDGKSLQAGTSHYLGQNFSKAFNIKFLDKDSSHKYAYQTSWGVTTRLIGALIMVHGDQRGLVLPPKIAPVQVLIVPIAAHKGGVTEHVEAILKEIKKRGIRAEADNRDETPGFKFNDCEMKGIPLRLEIGPRDIEAGDITVVRRDTLEKLKVKIKDVKKEIPKLLKTIHNDMFKKAEKYLNNRIKAVKNLEELEAEINNKNFVKAGWCRSCDCEALIKEKTGATSRVMPFDEQGKKQTCVICGKETDTTMIFARAY